MNKDYKEFEKEYDSLKEVIEFQNNMYNPGHYVGTGKVPPTVSATGNATPLAVMCFLGAVLFASFGLFCFFSDVKIASSGLIESPIANKIIFLMIMLTISAFLGVFGFSYLKKAIKYYKEKRKLENEPTDESVTDKLWQRTCPDCGKSHDIDYPKCPYCNFNYHA